jgi:hypothetical protein
LLKNDDQASTTMKYLLGGEAPAWMRTERPIEPRLWGCMKERSFGSRMVLVQAWHPWTAFREPLKTRFREVRMIDLFPQ